MSFLASVVDTLFLHRDRSNTMKCPCGAVVCKIKAPPSSFALVDMTSALCHCDDCVGFCRACPNGDHIIENNASHMVNFYKSDVTVVKGQDRIRGIKQREDTVLVRLYCGDCGTPLGSELTVAPIILLYSKLFVDGPIYMPTMVLGTKWAPPDTRPYHGNIVTRYYNYGFWFTMKVISRVFLGFLFGKNSGGLLLGNYDEIPVGRDKIKKIADKDE